MFLFDTDVIIDILRGTPSTRLVERLSKTNRSCQFISTITLSELVYGAHRSANPEKHLKQIEAILIPSVSVAFFDSQAAYVCGMLRAEFAVKGIPLGTCDMQIAAIAMARGMILVTRNIRHFKRIHALKVEDWTL